MRKAFAFLNELGFVLTAADAWDLVDDAYTIAWERADAVVLATLALDGSFFVLLASRPAGDEDNTPTRARLGDLVGARDGVAAFGSFPVLAPDSAGVAAEMERYLDVFQARLGRLLADRPIDPPRLAAESEAAIDDIRRPRLIDHERGRAKAAWADERWASYLDAAEQLEWLGAPLDTPVDVGRIAVAAALRPPPMTLGDDPIEEPERTRRAVALVAETQARLDRAVAERHRDAAAWARWEEAARAWHEALELVYPPDFFETLERLRVGEPDAVEAAIAFLEIDPWAFRTGYAKETILRYIKRADLDPSQAARLRAVVLRAVDVGDRREFRGHCKLARRIVDDQLRIDLLARLRSEDSGIARRALWVLDALGEPLGPDDRAIAQGVLERSARDPQWWRSSGWIRRDVQRYGDQAWIDRLLARGLEAGPDQDVALRLLTSVRIEPTDAQREKLGALVLEALRRDDDSYWIEGIAASADHPALRDALITAYRDATDDVERRLTGWAINAIRRAAADGWPGNPLEG